MHADFNVWFPMRLPHRKSSTQGEIASQFASRFAWAAIVILIASPVACGDSNDDAKHCATIDDCSAWLCTCADGATFNNTACVDHTCLDGEDACGYCESFGGTASVVRAPTLIGTPECTAVCAKVDELACNGIRCPHQYCDVPPGSCEEQLRDYLSCAMANAAAASCAGPGMFGDCGTNLPPCP